MRSGMIAKKVGMTRLFMEDGRQVPVTVLHVDNLQVVAQRTSDKDGYTAVQLGAGTAKAKTHQPADARPFCKAQRRAKAESCGISCVRTKPYRCGGRTVGGTFSGRSEGGRDRHIHR